MATPGTSPRARGKRAPKEFPEEPGRNIPACAGKTFPRQSFFAFDTEHPRVRGENMGSLVAWPALTGTSPRARGKQVDSLERYGYPRNIPACAGKTPLGRRPMDSVTEHPRVRGENTRFALRAQRVKGTSPRARGKLRVDRGLWGCIRNIPACAGKTLDTPSRESYAKEHPRVRGENNFTTQAADDPQGTSPRARGKLWVPDAPATKSRNIPACAGKTCLIYC